MTVDMMVVKSERIVRDYGLIGRLFELLTTLFKFFFDLSSRTKTQRARTKIDENEGNHALFRLWISPEMSLIK